MQGFSFILLLFFLFQSILAFADKTPEFFSGDLIFQTAGVSGFSNAISDATAQNDSIKFIHVGIIEVADDNVINVIEASPEEGVRTISLDKFLEGSAKINGKPGAVVKRLAIDFPVKTVIGNAKSHIDEAYDWWYLPDNGKMYCSELVYESYITETGERIFNSSPMNFRASDGSIPEFWIKLYEELGVEIPEGIPGTNPNDLSKEPVLIEIFRFF